MIANISSQYLAEITPVLDGDYSSTWPRLLQYLVEITAVLGPSTGAVIFRGVKTLVLFVKR